MSEAELLEKVLMLCGERRLFAYHNPETKRATMAGFPDLVIWGRGGLLFRELKSQEGRHSMGQLHAINALRAAGASATTWRPADLESGRIRRELDAIARPR